MPYRCIYIPYTYIYMPYTCIYMPYTCIYMLYICRMHFYVSSLSACTLCLIREATPNTSLPYTIHRSKQGTPNGRNIKLVYLIFKITWVPQRIPTTLYIYTSQQPKLNSSQIKQLPTTNHHTQPRSALFRHCQGKRES